MATEALRRNGGLDRILVKTSSEHEGALRAALPPGVTLARYGSKKEGNRRMLAAFRWNLRVLSYVALIVGAFLIYNTVSVSVVRRRNEIGVLRALGATRGAVLSAFLGEAACFGVIGGLLGIALGRLMAGAGVHDIAITVESLYVSSRPGEIALTWPIALAGMLIACFVSFLSAFSPAWEASRIAPVEAMSRGRVEHEVRRSAVRYLAMSAACAVVAFVASQRAPVNGKPLFGYAAAVALIGTSAFAIPLLVPLVRGGRIFGAEAMLASRSLIGSMRRTSVLVGALSTAIAMTTAVGIMVEAIFADSPALDGRAAAGGPVPAACRSRERRPSSDD